jgi:hypothetical protein
MRKRGWRIQQAGMVALVRSRTSDISTSASRSLRDDMRLLGMFRAVTVIFELVAWLWMMLA